MIDKNGGRGFITGIRQVSGIFCQPETDGDHASVLAFPDLSEIAVLIEFVVQFQFIDQEPSAVFRLLRPLDHSRLTGT